MATRIVRYCGTGWIILACLNILVAYVFKSPLALLGALFAIAAARACFEHSRTATTMVFGIMALSAVMHIFGALLSSAGSWLLVLVWLVAVLSAFRTVKAIEFLNAEELRVVDSS